MNEKSSEAEEIVKILNQLGIQTSVAHVKDIIRQENDEKGAEMKQAPEIYILGRQVNGVYVEYYEIPTKDRLYSNAKVNAEKLAEVFNVDCPEGTWRVLK